MIMADHHFDGIPVTGVVDDSHGGARLVTEHLLELGHRRIGYVEIARREMNPWRYGGYADALKDAGIRPEPGLVSPSFGSFESGRMAGDALLAARNPPTAVFAFDDVRAWGVWRAAEARGLRVGRDFALAGYGDTAASSGFPEALTSVHFNYRKVGQVSVEKLSEYIGGTAGNGEIITLPTKLVVRESSRNARLRPEGRKAKTGGPV
jgi:LacI family transcriptional regulator